MAIQFDVGELSSELAKLRSRPQLHKLAIVLPISPAKREVAWDFLAEGSPFDIQAIGLDSTAPREAGNVGGANVEGAEDPRGVVRHHLHGDGTLGHRRPPRPGVVEGSQAVAAG